LINIDFTAKDSENNLSERAFLISMPEGLRGSRKSFLAKTPDSAALHPGYEPLGAHSAPYETLRVLRASFENTRAWMIYGMENPEYAK
jgi:hypothetical protein